MGLLSRLFRRARRFFTGEDIFISYSREDGTAYATALATALTDARISCLFDQWSASPDRRIPRLFRLAIRNSSLCVLVATEKATISPHIRDEIEEFRATNRTIIPIDAGGRAPHAVWTSLVAGAKWEVEDAAALAEGRPSAAVLTRIQQSCTFRTKDRRLRRSARLLSVALVALVIAAAGAYAWAKVSLKRANEAQARAAAETDRADSQSQLAQREGARAAAETDRADSQSQLAQREGARAAREMAATEAAEASRKSAMARLLTTRAQVARAEGDQGLLPSIYLAAESLTREESVGNRTLLADLLSTSLRQLPPLAQRDLSGISVQPRGSQFAVRAGRSIQLYDEARTPGRRFDLSGEATATAWSADGRTIAGGAKGGEIRIWSVDSGDSLASFSCDGNVANIALHPSATALFANCALGTFLWKKDPDWPRERPPRLQMGITGTFGLDPVRFIADGPRPGVVSILSYPALEEVATIPHAGRFLHRIVVDPTGSGRIAIDDDTGVVSVWHAGDTAPLARLSHPFDCVADVAFSGDGRLIATACVDGIARVFEAETGLLVAQVATAMRLEHVALGGMGQVLATAGREPMVRFWKLPPLGAGRSIDGETLLSGPTPYAIRADLGTVTATDLLTGEIVATFTAPFTSKAVVALLPARKIVLTTTGDRSTEATLQGWTVAAGAATRLWDAKLNLTSVVVSPDQRAIGVASIRMPGFSGTQPMQFRVLEPDTGHEVKRWNLANAPWNTLMTFTPKADRALVMRSGNGRQREILLLDVADGTSRQTPVPPQPDINAAAFSADGTLAALAEGLGHSYPDGFEERGTGGLDVYAVPSWRLVRHFTLAGSGKFIRFSADGAQVLTADDEAAKVFDIASGAEVFRVNDPQIRFADFLSGDQQIVVVDKTRVRRMLWRKKELLQEACVVLPRPLSVEEWSTRVPEESRPTLCR